MTTNAKKALLVGINYTSIPQVALRGCINDIDNVSNVLVDAYDYQLSNIVQLRDDMKDLAIQPTKQNILAQLQTLVAQSASLSEIWFHYSGHGSQIKDLNGDETSGQDQVLVPLDYQSAGMIVDDEIFNIVKNSKCKTMLCFDCCHSGSMCDLQWMFEFKNGSFLKTLNGNKIISNPNIICLSGCRDTQTAADSYSIQEARGVGAFTDALLYCLRVNRHNVNILKLYGDTCAHLVKTGFPQVPILSCSAVVPNYNFSRVTGSAIVQPTVSAPAPAPATTFVPTTTTTIKPTTTKDVPITETKPVIIPGKITHNLIVPLFSKPKTPAAMRSMLNHL